MNAIEFNNISKKFRKGDKVYALRDLIPKIAKGVVAGRGAANGLNKSEFWAIRDVTFSVKKGEVLGIIGPNGAGKSTILKLLSKLMRPDKGDMKIKGRLSALIEITAGFHPDFTGRENIYFNGAIYGMTRDEIEQKYEQIVEFSGVREFIDTPVKRYSSGMMARLGFAVAAHVDPDILLVDEVLSVGDMTFQTKCVRKMRELLSSGATVIFISHNIPLVQSLCERIILLDKGQILKEGYPEEVMPFYENLVSKGREEELKQQISKSTYQLEMEEEEFIHIHSVGLRQENGLPAESFAVGEPIGIRVDYRIKKDIEDVAFAYEIIRSDGILCCSSSTKDAGYAVPRETGEGKLDILVSDHNLAPGIYFTKISVWDKDMIHPYLVKKEGVFNIDAGTANIKGGPVLLPQSRWDMRKSS